MLKYGLVRILKVWFDNMKITMKIIYWSLPHLSLIGRFDSVILQCMTFKQCLSCYNASVRQEWLYRQTKKMIRRTRNIKLGRIRHFEAQPDWTLKTSNSAPIPPYLTQISILPCLHLFIPFYFLFSFLLDYPSLIFPVLLLIRLRIAISFCIYTLLVYFSACFYNLSSCYTSVHSLPLFRILLPYVLFFRLIPYFIHFFFTYTIMFCFISFFYFVYLSPLLPSFSSSCS